MFDDHEDKARAVLPKRVASVEALRVQLRNPKERYSIPSIYTLRIHLHTSRPSLFSVPNFEGTSSIR